MNETIITIIGNVITDVTPRKTADGTRVANFRVASNQRRYDKETQCWIDGDPLFVAITCWRDLAKNVVSTLVKGDPVVVVGRLYTRRYEVEGQKRSITEVDARAVGPDLSRCRGELERRRRDAADDATTPDTAIVEQAAAENANTPGEGTNGTGEANVPSASNGAGPTQSANPNTGVGVPPLHVVGAGAR